MLVCAAGRHSASHHHPGSSRSSSKRCPGCRAAACTPVQKLEENFELLTKLTSVMKQDPQGEEMAKK